MSSIKLASLLQVVLSVFAFSFFPALFLESGGGNGFVSIDSLVELYEITDFRHNYKHNRIAVFLQWIVHIHRTILHV